VKFLTEDFPGIGGVYKQTPDDFQVEEIPLYPCSGEGEHLYLWIEKTGITTYDLIHQLALQLNIRERDIGYAGLKDARALTRQMISIPLDTLDRLGNLTLNGAKILRINRHNNKLRLGHLSGNRFTITVRDIGNNPLSRVEDILAELQNRGVPNLFGEQRYGILGNSDQLGRLLLQKNFTAFIREFIGDPALVRNSAWQQAARLYRADNIIKALTALPKQMQDERRLLQALSTGESHQAAVLSLPHKLLRLYLSAAQSRFFDQLLLQRLPHLDQLWDGDIAVKHANGACFRVEETATEQSRANSFEISPSAPLFGHKVLLASGKQGTEELKILQKNSLKLSDWKLDKGLTMPGGRRPLRIPLTEIDIIDQTKKTLTLHFSLPKGSYATSLLREVIKHPC